MWPDAFAWPPALLLLVVPVALAARRLRQAGRTRAVASHATALFGPLPRTLAERARALPDAIRIAALACLIVALAGPLAWRTTHTEIGGADVLLLVDVSGSMQALDFAPDRLGAAKAFASRLVARRPDDRFAVMSFAGRSALRVPLTRDHEAVLAALADLAPDDDLLGEGTALGAALVTAVERLTRGGTGDRLVIVLTDGESVREMVPPADAAAFAASRGVRVVAIGIGSGGRVPYPTEFGPIEVTLPLDAATLHLVADRTRGRYFAAPDEPSLRAVSDAIDEMETPAPVDIVRDELVGVAQAWMFVALALVTTELWLAATWLRRYPE